MDRQRFRLGPFFRLIEVVGEKGGKAVETGLSLSSDRWIQVRGSFDWQMGEQRPETKRGQRGKKRSAEQCT